ncbi:UNKNOWN [Stylonychia lemnae]|uniref:Transmembrane protein n=1 Tax=Stylonychia lemnae TaxID=5949 RepID=A0A078A907_STYLE|nr:UNKNOWN [Stylonychia lemnae]|eukprot:CDW78356.1 UNKNOWN [Stylonychia lemnae]
MSKLIFSIFFCVCIFTGIQLIYYGYYLNGVVIVAINIFCFALNALSFWNPDYDWICILTYFFNIAQWKFQIKVDDEVTQTLKEFKKQYPYLGIWDKEILTGNIYPDQLKTNAGNITENQIFYLANIRVQMFEQKIQQNVKVLSFKNIEDSEKGIKTYNQQEESLKFARLEQFNFRNEQNIQSFIAQGELSTLQVQDHNCIIVKKVLQEPQQNEGLEKLQPANFGISGEDMQNGIFSLAIVGEGDHQFAFLTCETCELV